MRQAGANLVEVGTTNRTHIADYAQAAGRARSAVEGAYQQLRHLRITASVGTADPQPWVVRMGSVAVDLGSGS